MRTDRRTFVRLGVGGTMGGLLSLVLAQDSGKRGIKIGCGLNPRFTKRFVRTVKESCLDRMILFGEESFADHHAQLRRPLSHRAQSPGVGH